jgi:hypothetical protein
LSNLSDTTDSNNDKVKADTEAMTRAIELIMKYAKSNNYADLTVKDLPEMVGNLTRVCSLLYLAIDRLIMLQEPPSTGLGTTKLRDILEGLYQ